MYTLLCRTLQCTECCMAWYCGECMTWCEVLCGVRMVWRDVILCGLCLVWCMLCTVWRMYDAVWWAMQLNTGHTRVIYCVVWCSLAWCTVWYTVLCCVWYCAHPIQCDTMYCVVHGTVLSPYNVIHCIVLCVILYAPRTVWYIVLCCVWYYTHPVHYSILYCDIYDAILTPSYMILAVMAAYFVVSRRSSL